MDQSCEYTKNFEDVVLSQCMFGTPYQKATRFRCFGWVPEELRKRCHGSTRQTGKLPCGNGAHRVLEFGGELTALSAAYPPNLCRAYARSLVSLRCEIVSRDRAYRGLQLAGEGEKVKRHKLRGDTTESKKENKKLEHGHSQIIAYFVLLLLRACFCNFVFL